MKSQTNSAWRWIALFATIAGVVYNYIFAAGNKLSVITDKYESLFVPAGYAFAIWGLIYLSVIIYIIYSCSRLQKPVRLHNGLAKLLTFLALGGIAWITAYTGFQLGISVVIIFAMLALAILALKSAHIAITEKNQPQTLIIPFALYAGWLSVASISNLSLLIKSAGWLEGTLSEAVWASIMLFIAGALGIAVAIRYRTIIYTAVICWATIAIWVKQTSTIVDNTALAVSIVLFVFIGVFLWRLRPMRSIYF